MVAKNLRFASNIARQCYEYVSRKTELKSKPAIFWIDTISHCNLRCPFCPTTYAPNEAKGVMSLDLFKSIIDQICDFTLESYLFQTGEPLMNKDITSMVAYMTEKGMTSIMHTNGTLWNQKRAAALLDAELDFISFSFDGYDAETYEKSRVNGKFEETVNNIIGVLQLKQRRGKSTPYIRIQTLVSPERNEQFSEKKQAQFRQLFDGLPVDEFDQEPISNLARDTQGGDVYQIEKPLTIDEHQQQGYKFKPCMQLWSSMTIRWDGTVVPCCIDFETVLPLGDVKQDRILDIWNGKPMQDLRKQHVKKTLDSIPLCSTCDVPFGPDLLGIPVGMSGHGSLFRKYWGPMLHTKLLRPLRFFGGRITKPK